MTNMGINYDGIKEKLNTSDYIAGVETERGNVSNPGTTKVSYSKAVIIGNGKKKLIFAHPLY